MKQKHEISATQIWCTFLLVLDLF